MQGQLNKLIDRIREVLGPKIVSVLLYGSKAGEENFTGHSDYNLLVILNEIDYTQFSIMHDAFKKSNLPVVPVFFTEEEINTSKDVFPIDFFEIKDSYKILHGKDIFADMKIEVHNLRHEIEYELRSKILKLRSAYIKTSNANDVSSLLAASISGVLAVLKNSLRLKNIVPPPKKGDAIEMFAKAFDQETLVFKEIIEIKNSGKHGDEKAMKQLFIRYIRELETAAAKIDKL